jgi:Cu(I)/Ag(I) efflux system periplasmic protein CusF
MKRLAILAAVLFAVAAQPARAQQGGMDMKDMDMRRCKEMMDKGMGMKGMDMPKECRDMMDKQPKSEGQGAAKKGGDKKAGEKKSQAKVHKGAGVPTKVDAAAGKVTIDHGPIQTLGWPAMNMTFTVKDKAMLDHVHQGNKVEFEFVQQGSDYVITKIH